MKFFKLQKLYDVSFILLALKRLIMISLVVLIACTVFFTPDKWYITVTCGLWAVVSFLIKDSAKTKYKHLFVFFILDFVSLLGMMYFISLNNIYTSSLCLLMFASQLLHTDFKKSIYLFFLYFVGVVSANLIARTIPINAYATLIYSLTEATIFLIFFTIFELSLILLKKNQELRTTLSELTEKEKRLLEANKKIQQSATLEERNRIAKQIHDTTGHSITNIIMQSEAAKLVIDKDPIEAKKKIISCNVTAVSALEELRQSVKILSGWEQSFNLNEKLNNAIAESTNNTGIVIRSKIEDVNLSEEISTFIYSSFKEGLNNGVRHGGSTAFYFELSNIDDGVLFILSDNGCGTNNLNYGFGLTHMTDVAKSLGIQIEFSSEVDEGFEIKMIIPSAPSNQ